MSKKRANKSKRRRDPQKSGSPSAPPPRLKLVPAPPAGEGDQPSGVRFLREAERFDLPEEPAPVSTPPESVEDIEEEARFFHEGRVHTPHAFAVSEDHDDLVEAPKPSPKMTAAARARRAQFSKYVKGAMVAASAILALAGIRAVIGHSDRDPRNFVASVASPPPAALTLAPQSPPAPPASVATTGAQLPETTPAPPPEPAKADPAPAEPAKPIEAAKIEPAKAEPAKAEPAKTEPAKTEPAKAEPAKVAAAPDPATGKAAAQEKADARKLLERGKAGAAIEAGERSVALDPTDGEAWLILGAAYQEKGNLKDARRAFQACAKQGKRGPISECRAMLQ